MSSALFLFLLLLLFSNTVLSDPASLSFKDCFDSSRGNASQKVTISKVYGQVFKTFEDESYLNLTMIGSTPQEILDTSDEGGNLATLFTTTTVLTLGAWSNSSRFCSTLRPPSPLPSPNNLTQLYCPVPAGPFAFSSTIPWGSARALTTLNTRLSAVDPFSQQLICLDVETTPLDPAGEELYGKAVAIFWGSVGLAIAYWMVVGIARIVSAWNRGITRPDKGLWERAQSAGYILASAISGERFAITPALLRFCTPSMRDIMFHTQWCAALSMVAVQWPSFVYPLLTQTAWATLTYNVTLTQGVPHRWNPLSTSVYNPPSNFADQLSDPQSPLFIDRKTPNLLFTLPDNATTGITSFAYTVGVRPEDLFSICLILFLSILAAITVLSLVIWFIDYMVCLGSGIISKSHQGNAMKLPGTRSPGFTSRDMLDTVPNPNAEESKSLNGRDLPGIIRPPSRFTLTAATTASGPTPRKWWKVRADLNGFHASVLHGNLVRILVLFHLPVTIFSVYEMTLPRATPNASLTGIVLAALSFAVFSVLVPLILVIRVRLTTTNKLYAETRTLLSLGPLYNHYGHGSQMFASMFFATNIVFGVIIGAGQKSGTAQAIVILVIEVASALFTSIWLPWGTGASMGLISFLFCVARIVIAVLLVILTPVISIGSGPGGWVAYGILIILALIYLALALMLVVKLMEAAVRIVGGINFDRSRHVVDGGLFGACGLLGCCGSRRHYRSRRNDKYKQKASTTGGRSQRDSDISSYAAPTRLAAMNTGDSRKGSLNSGPPPSVLKPEHALRPYKEESDDEPGFIMGAWQPFQSQQSGYIPVKETAPPAKASGFSRVGGGRAHIDSPYAITGGGANQSNPTFPSMERPSPIRATAPENHSASTLPRPAAFDDESPPPSVSSASAFRQQPNQDSLPPGAMAPFHVRTKSQTAIIEDPGMLIGMRRHNEPSTNTAVGPPGGSRPPSRSTRLDSAPPPTSYRHSAAASEDSRSSVDQPRKKPWYKLRRNRPHSSEGYNSRSQDEENVLSELLDIPPPSTTTPGKSFVVIRKNQPSPGRPPQAPGAGGGSGSRSTGEPSPVGTPTPNTTSFAKE
ncbi:hypothetical protein E1B28_004761 [Marasmius oreades]|uniref:TRP C-terminal domain-containing protein n=1 Tax=Marasmius oreades TaxID=181124 RepID=A0A9P7UZ97_9AGAR|nr:uncharacterized protein E1B28_004761 [Marasmius oreades]KAG7097414.1 hypothetical protein E1B28_004761 [Marasmius oreades]